MERLHALRVVEWEARSPAGTLGRGHGRLTGSGRYPWTHGYFGNGLTTVEEGQLVAAALEGTKAKIPPMVKWNASLHDAVVVGVAAVVEDLSMAGLPHACALEERIARKDSRARPSEGWWGRLEARWIYLWDVLWMR